MTCPITSETESSTKSPYPLGSVLRVLATASCSKVCLRILLWQDSQTEKTESIGTDIAAHEIVPICLWLKRAANWASLVHPDLFLWVVWVWPPTTHHQEPRSPYRTTHSSGRLSACACIHASQSSKARIFDQTCRCCGPPCIRSHSEMTLSSKSTHPCALK